MSCKATESLCTDLNRHDERRVRGEERKPRFPAGCPLALFGPISLL